MRANQPEYLAALVEFGGRGRSVIYIYDSRKRLVYQEVLPGTSAAIARRASGTAGAEALLMGRNNQAWPYTAAH